MKKTAEKFVEQAMELKKEAAKVIIETDSDVFANMSDAEFNLMRKSLVLMDIALGLTMQQAVMMDEMNAKLDKLLKEIEPK